MDALGKVFKENMEFKMCSKQVQPMYQLGPIGCK